MGTSDEDLVQLTRVLRAPPGKVFAAWTDPALLERWWTGVGGWVDAKADVDLRVGGRYHLSMRDERGALHDVIGVYTEVVPIERLAFTWTWENEPSVMRGSEGSLVDVALRGAPGGTQVSLTHTGLGGKRVRDMHEEGWNALLTRLFAVLS
jgi:uncharacterized protein YndB with AHSA1/START domain